MTAPTVLLAVSGAFDKAVLTWRAAYAANGEAIRAEHEAQQPYYAEYKTLPPIYARGTVEALKAKHRFDEIDAIAEQACEADHAALIAVFATPAAKYREVLAKVQIAIEMDFAAQAIEDIKRDLIRLECR